MRKVLFSRQRPERVSKMFPAGYQNMPMKGAGNRPPKRPCAFCLKVREAVSSLFIRKK